MRSPIEGVRILVCEIGVLEAPRAASIWKLVAFGLLLVLIRLPSQGPA